MSSAQSGLHLRWEALTYDVAVPAPPAAPKAGADCEEGTAAVLAQDATPPGVKRILHAVSGQVLPGQLLAVAGPSGSGVPKRPSASSALGDLVEQSTDDQPHLPRHPAGKTSLMKLLAGRRPQTSGKILVNGATTDPPSFKRASGFVAQTTVCLDTLTVRETIVTTALLRLDRSVPVAAKLARAEEVIAAIGLLKVADSRIGNDVAGGISGGERRRLSIGVEVVHKPKLLLLGATPAPGVLACTFSRSTTRR